MKKIILSIFIICSVTNILHSMEMNNNNNNNNNNLNNNNNRIECPELPKEMWVEILLKLININKIEEAKTLPELFKALQEMVNNLRNFALSSKKNHAIVKDILNREFNINGQTTKLKEYYIQMEKEILQKIEKQLIENSPFPYHGSYWFNNINAKCWGSLWTALMLTSYYGFVDLTELLINNGADINSLCPEGTALILAVNAKKIEIINILISHKADLNLPDIRGKTALMHAVIQGNKEIVELLISYKPDLNLQDQNGKTALMHAVDRAYGEIAELLMADGADTNIKNKHGETAFDIAVRSKQYKIAKILSPKDLNTNTNLFERSCLIQ